MLKVFPSIADEEILLDDADQKPANQEGATDEIVNEAEKWNFEAIAEEADAEEIDKP